MTNSQDRAEALRGFATQVQRGVLRIGTLFVVAISQVMLRQQRNPDTSWKDFFHRD